MTSVAIHDSKPTRHREFRELSAVKVVTFALQFGSKNPYSYRYLRKKWREADKNVLPISWTQKLALFCSPCPFPSQFGMRQSCNPSQRCLHAERWCRHHAYQKVSSCRSAAPFHPTRTKHPVFFAKSATYTNQALASSQNKALGPCRGKKKNNSTPWKLHVPPIYSIHSSRHLQEFQPTNPTSVLRPGITIRTNDKSRRYQTIMISTLRKDVNKIYHRAWHLQPSFCWKSINEDVLRNPKVSSVAPYYEGNLGSP